MSGSRFGSLIMMQRTLATLCNGIALKASTASPPSSSSVIHAVDEGLLDIGHGVPEICNECPSRFCPCRRHPRYAVIVDLLSRQRRVRVRVLLERIRVPVAAVPSGIPSQAEGHWSLEVVRGLCAVSLGVDVSTIDLGFYEPRFLSSVVTSTSTSAAAQAVHSAPGSTSAAAQTDHIVPPSTSTP